MKKILITGKQGQVGQELQRALAPFGTLHSFDRQGLNLSSPSEIRRVIHEVQPDIIVNAAAYTLVDKAESEADTAMAINAEAAGILAEEAKNSGALFIHYSTDYVFDGNKRVSYWEDDVYNPLNVYGRSKLEGEKAIVGIGGKFLILRTSWVYGLTGHNFLLIMLRLGKERSELKIVGDQVGAPTWSRSIAEKTADLISRFIDGKIDEKLSGIYHLTSAGQTSWFGFAEAIFTLYQQRCQKLEKEFVVPRLIRIPSTEYPTLAIRPKYSVLSNDKIGNTFGIVMPHWEDALQQCLSEHPRQ